MCLLRRTKCVATCIDHLPSSLKWPKAREFKTGTYFSFFRPQKSETPWEKVSFFVKRFLFVGFLPQKITKNVKKFPSYQTRGVGKVTKGTVWDLFLGWSMADYDSLPRGDTVDLITPPWWICRASILNLLASIDIKLKTLDVTKGTPILLHNTSTAIGK